MIRLPIITWW